MSKNYIGVSIERKEGLSKVKGKSIFVDDLKFKNMIYGATVRSPIARGKLKKIVFNSGIPWSEFAIVTYKDIIGKNYIASIYEDQPCLVNENIMHTAQPIVLLAHSNQYLLKKAVKYVHLEIEAMKPVLSIEESLKGKEIILNGNNIIKSIVIKKGNINKKFVDCKVVKGSYKTGAQEQLYIETNGVIAYYNGDCLKVWGSIQCPFYVQKALQVLFLLPPNKNIVIQTETGGGFGGKEDYPSILAAHASLLSYKSKKPVKMVYERSEDMLATTKRHPSRTIIKTIIDKNGKLITCNIDFVLDGGAFTTLSPVVLSRGCIHAMGPYYCPNVLINGKVVATNTPPNGAFRGFGAPQSIFAIERHMDRIAKYLNISCEEVRNINFAKKNQTMSTGQIIKEEVDFKGLMKKIFIISNFKKKYKNFIKYNKLNLIKKGIAFSTFLHGSGFTGLGEKFLASVISIEISSIKKVKILSSSTEIGQGKNTVFSQIVAQEFGININNVEIVQPNTSFVPDSGPTVASRTTMIVGNLLRLVACEIKELLKKENLLKNDYNIDDFWNAIGKYIKINGNIKKSAKYKYPLDMKWDDENCKGDAYPCYVRAVYVAEVSVNTLTYQVAVNNFWALQEVGKVINPNLAKGQIHGGVVQGIGFALFENSIFKNGAMVNNQMSNYIVPTFSDVPNINVFFNEDISSFGPYGAKGIGELPIDGTAPAIVGAIENAIDISFNSLPVSLDDVMISLEGLRE